MGFGGKLKKTSELTIDGMTFEVSRITNFIRREISEIERSDMSMTDKLKAKRDFYAKHLIKGWRNVTEQSLADHLVTNATHYGSKSFDVNGDDVDVNRASFDDLFALIETAGSESDMYAERARIAIDELLLTQDAKIVYNGSERKMNASIREEIKSSEDWEDVVNEIWEMAADYKEYRKKDLSENPIAFSESAVNDYLIGAYTNIPPKHILDEVYKFANDNESYREQLIQDEESAAKN